MNNDRRTLCPLQIRSKVASRVRCAVTPNANQQEQKCAETYHNV
jgi:hypothetical protein